MLCYEDDNFEDPFPRGGVRRETSSVNWPFAVLGTFGLVISVQAYSVL